MVKSYFKIVSFKMNKKNYRKICPKCKQNNTKKYGNRNGRKQYFCNICKKKFQKKRKNNKILNLIQKEYSHGKQTQKQIAKKIGKSRKWVNENLKKN